MSVGDEDQEERGSAKPMIALLRQRCSPLGSSPIAHLA